MNSSQFAFEQSAARLFETHAKIYFWTFTLVETIPDWCYSSVWDRLSRDLQNVYGGTLAGLKVIELHAEHGIHWHCLLNRRVWVGQVRRIGRRYGVGRVHVKRADQGAIAYLTKYLSKEWKQEHRMFARCARWGTVGRFRGVKIRNVEMSSPWHERMRICQEATGRSKFPFIFARAILAWPDATRSQLEKAALNFVRDGHIGLIKV